MIDDADNGNQGGAEDTRGSPVNMRDTAGKRTPPSRWFGIGAGLLVASLIALYALPDPYPYIVFPIAGLGIFITAARAKSGAHKHALLAIKANMWASVPVVAMLFFVFFGSVVIRRTYDVYWVPIIAGLLVGLTMFLINESARRSYLARSGD
ncbi:MAG: hypothetical protein ACR2OM_11810 [Aestuariivirgaceae bacterium]